jgi:tRNA A-37 threonylcarbamoyl transferase component Bud32
MDNPTTHMSTSARTCPACHQPLPADAPQGLCPQCLAKSALGSQPGSEETVASGSKPGGSGPATIQPEIARLFPQLEIMEPLGQGGMGMVYKARQPQLDRVVALKVMRADLSRDPAFAERFAREARALAKLNHPNIVSVFDFGQSGGHCWILMEFVDGTNLRELLRTKTLQPREALGIVPKVCDALQYAHDEGIVHRDIKPENILLDKKGRVKIADFGLAKLVGKDASEFSLTATGMTLGTPRYMAPEQFDKPQEVDHRADIYSLGVVLYEMLTGEVPMGRFSLPSATIGVDVRLDEIVLRTLEKEPSRRYQHVSEVKTQVESIAGMVANLPPVLRQALCFEYKSKTEWFGLPLVHIAYGMDLQTGKTRVAKGVLAIGNVAKGVVAFGGAAYGGFAFGGLALGVVAIGGLGLGLFSFAGLAIALIAAYGGLAVAPVALGGFAMGYYACGGAAFGPHAVGGNANDPEARRLFSGLMANWKLLNAACLTLLAGSFVVPFVVTLWARRQAQSSAPAGPQVPASAAEPGSGATLLLDETDRSARQFQHLFFLGGMTWIVLGTLFTLVFPNKLPGAIALCVGGIAMLVMASRHRQQWEVDYLGHVIRFENGIYTSGRLMIDGNIVASGGVGFQTELSGRIPRGSGAGHRIVAKTHAGFRSFRCRLFAEPTATTSAKEVAPANLDSPASSRLGQLSLGLALAGIALPIGLLLLALAAAAREHQSGMLILCVVLGALLELAAFGCGVVGRRSLAGKAGMVISGLVLLAGLLLAPSVILQPGERTSGPSRFLGVLPHTAIEIAKDPSKLPATTTPGRRDFAFTFNAPSNHVLNVWLEFWKDGKLEIPTAFSESYLPARGDSVRGGLHLITQDGDMAGVGSAGQMRFDWALSRHARVVSDIAKLDSKATSSSGQWRTNLFKERAGLASQLSWDDQSVPTVWRPKPGEVTTVLAWTGHAGKSVSSSDLKWTEEGLPKGTPMVAILLRVRFDPVTPDQLSVAPMTKTAAINAKNRGPLTGKAGPTAGSQSDKKSSPVPPAPAPRFNIQPDRTQLPTAQTPGRQDYAFKFTGPADHTLNVWLEVWREGKLEIVEGCDFLARPKQGAPLEGALRLATTTGDIPKVVSLGKVRVDWTMNCGGSEGKSDTGNTLITNLITRSEALHSTWGRAPKDGWHPRSGETVTLLACAGQPLTSLDGFIPEWSYAELLKVWPKTAMLVRARFNPARQSELTAGPTPTNHAAGRDLVRQGIAPFILSHELGADVSSDAGPQAALATLAGAASTPAGRARAVAMMTTFRSGNPGWSSAETGAFVQGINDVFLKGDKASAGELVNELAKFITHISGSGRYTIWWMTKPKGIVDNRWREGGLLELSGETARKLGLTPAQVTEVNQVLNKYEAEARALKRRHTKVTKDEKGQVLVTIEHYSEECLALARKLVAELGGVVTQDILPTVEVGTLPSEVFGEAGECRETIEMKKENGAYFIVHRTSDYLPAQGRFLRGGSTTSWGHQAKLMVIPKEYRMFWPEE